MTLSKALFLRLASAKGCQGIRETKMRNGGRFLLADQKSYVCMYELKFVWRYSTLIIPSLRAVALGICCKQRQHGGYHFGF
jgi:hypothetical protein